jgi:hypothetical protein
MSYSHLKSLNFVIFDGKSEYNDVAILFIAFIALFCYFYGVDVDRKIATLIV